ncbi:MAG: hypothetical protein GXX83_04195 [Gaiellales bacterium]|nr:hypothetical protein [Gaiellales bacterium]
MDHETIRKGLLDERVKLERELLVFEKELSSSVEETSGESPYGQHLAENAAAALDREMDLTLEGNLREVLRRIDRALLKLDDGSYGVCDKCGGPIGEDRLEAAPYAVLCMTCKRREERSR